MARIAKPASIPVQLILHVYPALHRCWTTSHLAKCSKRALEDGRNDGEATHFRSDSVIWWSLLLRRTLWALCRRWTSTAQLCYQGPKHSRTHMLPLTPSHQPTFSQRFQSQVMCAFYASDSSKVCKRCYVLQLDYESHSWVILLQRNSIVRFCLRLEISTSCLWSFWGLNALFFAQIAQRIPCLGFAKTWSFHERNGY